MKQKMLWRVGVLFGVALGFGCFLAGIMLPMMTVKKLIVVKNTFSVLGGIGELLADKTFGLGLLLLFFSVVFPLLKFALIAAYAWVYPSVAGALSQWQGWLGKVAKFSMLDVFVVAQMLMILKLGWLVEVQIHSGIYWFTAALMFSLGIGMMIDRDIRQRLKNAY
ncbi:paraquat-inducible protein A [Suttonella ornithocola]|uniref:Uncharacterized paraquat-inducible protein A n=1 Tax=Suttonella ornithocola TaxID=279832 RepID=A0A380MZ62_9GAMM|nr:paraquat-inducible protein A [Suttonella ornithocola]SUO97845.1 Uncharacterized paraquat-inducible protein A [Suttonella ornithocola]